MIYKTETSSLFSIDLDTLGEINNLIITSDSVFIADLDFNDDFTENKYLKVINSVEKVRKLSFRVYRTFKGLRAIETTRLHPLSSGNERLQSVGILQSLYSDEKYVDYVIDSRLYAARLSPKQDRKEEDYICELIKVSNTPSNYQIGAFLRVHDSFCLLNSEWCSEWKSYDLKSTREEREIPQNNLDTPF